MNDQEFDEMVKRNEWHPNLQALLEVVAKCVFAQGSFDWHWSRSRERIKYIDVRIDMRDGGYTIHAADSGKRISHEQLWQWGQRKESPKAYCTAVGDHPYACGCKTGSNK